MALFSSLMMPDLGVHRSSMLYDFAYLRVNPLVPYAVPVEVTWLPPHEDLHYQALYRGLWDYMRAPPSEANKGRALQYLGDLLSGYSPHNWLQRDRIRWTRAWLRELDGEDECSDCETEVADELYHMGDGVSDWQDWFGPVQVPPLE